MPLYFRAPLPGPFVVTRRIGGRRHTPGENAAAVLLLVACVAGYAGYRLTVAHPVAVAVTGGILAVLVGLALIGRWRHRVEARETAAARRR